MVTVGLDSIRAVYNCRALLGTFQYQLAIQTAVARTDNPDAWSTLDSLRTTSGELCTGDVALSLGGKWYARFGAMYNEATTPGTQLAPPLGSVGRLQINTPDDVYPYTSSELTSTLTFAAQVLCANADLVDWAICKFVAPPKRAQMQETAAAILNGTHPLHWLITAQAATSAQESDGLSASSDQAFWTIEYVWDGDGTTGSNVADAIDHYSGSGVPGYYDCYLVAQLAHELMHILGFGSDADQNVIPCQSLGKNVQSEVLYYLLARNRVFPTHPANPSQ